MKLTLIILIVVGAIFFVGVSIAGSANKYFIEVVEKKSNLVFSGGLTAFEFARRAIIENNLNITIAKTTTKYGDHYSHKARQIAISEDFLQSDSLVGNAITAHEIGHAITDAKNDLTYRVHYALALFTKFLNAIFYLLVVAALVLYIFYPSLKSIAKILFYISAGTVALTLFFKILTVSNERNASNIGYELLKKYGASGKELRAAKAVYKAALTTYVGAIFMPIVKVLNFIMDIIYNTIGRLFRR